MSTRTRGDVARRLLKHASSRVGGSGGRANRFRTYSIRKTDWLGWCFKLAPTRQIEAAGLQKAEP